jgi:hypothetical protein
MKLRLSWLASISFLLFPAILFAGASLSIDDVLRLHYAGVSDEVIISEIIVTDSEFDLEVDDILRLTEAGFSDRLIKFMIDTGLPAAEEETSSSTETEESASSWVSSIEEEPAETTTYWLSLNYNYGAWWYDCYWDDYWYWDFHYYPYRVSYSWSIGAWYPTWYSYWGCYTPPWYGYRNGWGVRFGYNHYYYGYHDPYFDTCYDPYYGRDGWRDRWAGDRHSLSEVKYKVGASGGVRAHATGGLKLKDGRRLSATKGSLKAPEPKNPRGDVVYSESPSPVEPGRFSRPVRAVKTPPAADDVRLEGRRTEVRYDGRGSPRRPTRTIAKPPARGDRPDVVREPTGAAQAPETDNGKPSSPEGDARKPTGEVNAPEVGPPVSPPKPSAGPTVEAPSEKPRPRPVGIEGKKKPEARPAKPKPSKPAGEKPSSSRASVERKAAPNEPAARFAGRYTSNRSSNNFLAKSSPSRAARSRSGSSAPAKRTAPTAPRTSKRR